MPQFCMCVCDGRGESLRSSSLFHNYNCFPCTNNSARSILLINTKLTWVCYAEKIMELETEVCLEIFFIFDLTAFVNVFTQNNMHFI